MHLLRSFSRISSSDIFFLRFLSAARGVVEEAAGVALPPSAGGGETGDGGSSLAGMGGRGSITERV